MPERWGHLVPRATPWRMPGARLLLTSLQAEGRPPLRTTHPTLLAANRAALAHRDAMQSQWLSWLGERITGTSTTPRALVADEFGLILDTFATLVGPLRRETMVIWARVTEFYGRHAAARGLAAGEVVEEMQYLRELLIRFLSPAIAQMRPRQSMALFLRLNRLVDRGVAKAVVGYTDALAATLVPSEDRSGTIADDPEAIRARLATLRAELADIARAEVPAPVR